MKLELVKKFIRTKIFIFVIVLLLPSLVYAQAVDSDADGLTDEEEIKIYTDPYKADTDADGYNDKEEIDNGYSPHRPDYLMYQLDWDKDGLNDALEIKFGTDLQNPDTDADGHLDGEEVLAGFDPLNKETVKLPKKIEINLERQELSYLVNDILIGTFQVSSGLPGKETPQGNYQIYSKAPKAWSKLAGLWMPYWMAFVPNGRFGIHELPYWPSGYREGADHLGKPVSHGCVRLGIGPAEFLYNWAEIGTPVIIS